MGMGMGITGMIMDDVPRKIRSRRPRKGEDPALRAAGDFDKLLDTPPARGMTVEPDTLAPTALYRLLAWLSPAFPVGAFSYSSGIEWGGFCDAVLFAQAHRAALNDDDKILHDVAELAAAFAPSKERHLETTAQGNAFIEAARAAWGCSAIDRFKAVWDGPVAYPVAVAVTAAGHGIALEPALAAYLQALAANWVSAGVRLIPLGQTQGLRVVAALEPAVAATAQRALAATLDDIGSAAFRADLASARHETQYTRLFRS